MTDITEKTNDNIVQDSKFRENVRRQLLSRGEGGSPQGDSGSLIELEPIAGAALRWIGAVAGSGLFLLGMFWLLAILGYAISWTAIFPLFAMYVGGWFLIGVAATRSSRKKRC